MTVDPNTPPLEITPNEPEPTLQQDDQPAAEVLRLREQLEREQAEKAQLLSALNQPLQMQAPAAPTDPMTGAQMSLQQMAIAAQDPEHPFHAVAQTHMLTLRAIQEQNARLEAMERQNRDQQALGVIPAEHRSTVNDFYGKNRHRFADPEAAYYFLRGQGTIKPPASDDARVAAVRAAAAPALPAPSAPAPAPVTKQMKRSEYIEAVRMNPSLRDEKDAGRLVIAPD